jgi:dTDP-glucose pyrophosphorylase
MIMKWGIIPAAGAGSRIQPLAFSKELLPVGGRIDGQVARPRAVSEYLVERMLIAGAQNICFVISPGKSDILEYYGGSLEDTAFTYMVQPEPVGLCDALFRSCPLIHADDQVLIGLPDTIWFPDNGLALLPDDQFSFLLFPVEQPELFDAVITDDVLEIRVKAENPGTNWVWGAFKMPGYTLHELRDLWIRRGRKDIYMGTLVNAWLEAGGKASSVTAGEQYVDVGTFNGYHSAMNLLSPESGKDMERLKQNQDYPRVQHHRPISRAHFSPLVAKG